MQEATIIKDAPTQANGRTVKEPKPQEAKPNRPKTGRGLAITALVLSIIALFSSTILSFLALGIIVVSPAYDSTRFVSEFTQDGNSANFTEGSIADVASRVAPSVVSIITEVKTKSYNLWFQPTEETSAAAGTGIIVSANGYVLTNKHVIDGATKIYIILADGTAYKNVELIGTDPLNDVAFLKIQDVSDLPAATLGDSKTITVGEQVIAIGNALGEYQNTVTSGIISGTGRSLTATDSNYQNAESLTDMIQTDAAINSGNSGGPLVNAAGEVIGINTAVSSGNNIGFAIPISSIKGMLKSVLETGQAQRAYAGISYNNIDATTALETDLASTFGAYVSSVIKGSPADAAGIKKDDIVLAVDNIKIGANTSLGTLLGEHSVGDTATLTVLRGDQQLTVQLTLAEYKE
ncbi:trypsin-like peptidase domain-containing protein [Candidatus Saccharibacteria bacterium]|nr:trypsin-like peptidase domain-containing protein [Candidatus Saccharibacteria bacterium]